MTDVNRLIADLAKSAEILAMDMKARTSSGRYPSDLSDSIVVSPVAVSGNTLSVKISVMHPAGAAYEFGSGVHATRGSAGTYEIRPKEANALAIPAEKWPEFEFPVKRGKKMMGMVGDTFLLRFVDHPGVEARPYMRPALQDKRQEIRGILKRSFVASFLGGREKETIEVRIVL